MGFWRFCTESRGLNCNGHPGQNKIRRVKVATYFKCSRVLKKISDPLIFQRTLLALVQQKETMCRLQKEKTIKNEISWVSHLFRRILHRKWSRKDPLHPRTTK